MLPLIKVVLISLIRILYQLSYRINSPKLTAIIFILLTKKLNPPRQYRVLCLGRSQFIDDIEALAFYGKNIQYIYIHKQYLGQIVRFFIPYTLHGGRTYHTDVRYSVGKEKAYSYIKKMIPLLIKFLKFDAVMSGNYVYIDQQEFFKICIQRQISCIVLNKEGVGAAHYLDKGLDYMKGFRFIGDGMLFINESIKTHDVKYLKGLSENDSVVVGIPRMDKYHYIKTEAIHQVVLFVFDIADYLHFLPQLVEKKDVLEKTTSTFHESVISFAQNNPMYKIIIKAKSDGRDYEWINKLYQNHSSKGNLKNVEITYTMDVCNLIMGSTCILGFNSTVLLEGIIANKTIISPDYSSILDKPKAWDIFYQHHQFVNSTNDYLEIEKILLDSKNYRNYSTEETSKFINKWIYKPDGKSCARAEDAMLNIIIKKAVS